VLLDGIWKTLDGVGWFLGSCKKLVLCWELRSSAQPYCSRGLNAERHNALSQRAQTLRQEFNLATTNSWSNQSVVDPLGLHYDQPGRRRAILCEASEDIWSRFVCTPLPFQIFIRLQHATFQPPLSLSLWGQIIKIEQAIRFRLIYDSANSNA
jgi:hypothetical protein